MPCFVKAGWSGGFCFGFTENPSFLKNSTEVLRAMVYMRVQFFVETFKRRDLIRRLPTPIPWNSGKTAICRISISAWVVQYATSPPINCPSYLAESSMHFPVSLNFLRIFLGKDNGSQSTSHRRLSSFLDSLCEAT